jgi:hypothetical protein
MNVGADISVAGLGNSERSGGEGKPKYTALYVLSVSTRSVTRGLLKPRKASVESEHNPRPSSPVAQAK